MLAKALPHDHDPKGIAMNMTMTKAKEVAEHGRLPHGVHGRGQETDTEQIAPDRKAGAWAWAWVITCVQWRSSISSKRVNM